MERQKAATLQRQVQCVPNSKEWETLERLRRRDDIVKEEKYKKMKKL